MRNSAMPVKGQSTSIKMYEEIINRIKSICEDVLSLGEIQSWVLGGLPELSMCFVGDNCPSKYRKDVMRIIKDVESNYRM
ncbi:MAG: hypothetical protein WBG43_05215 [Marinifilaceae bacterium]